MFKARGKPRRIGRETEKGENEEEGDDTGPVVRRPGISAAAKKPSKLRLSFGPGQNPDDQAGKDAGHVQPISGSAADELRKVATERSTIKRSVNAPNSLESLMVRAGRDEERPSYSKDYLNELRKSTPNTPQTLSAEETSDSEASLDQLMPSADTGGQLARVSDSAGSILIPTTAEIREKKERRARLAKEQEYMALSDDEDENHISLLPRKNKPEKRQVRDDEDFAEGFEQYVDDPGFALGRKAQAAQRQKARAEINELINEAEDSSDEDDSEDERNKAYAAAQTRAGMDGLARKGEASKSKAPTIITPIPRLSEVINRLRVRLQEKEAKKAQLTKQMEALQREKVEIAVREVEIQKLVTEAGQKYEQLRAEAGLSKDDGNGSTSENQKERGLESYGT